MFGAMPSDFMVFEVGEEPQVEEDENDEASSTPVVDSTKWDIKRRCVACLGLMHWFDRYKACVCGGEGADRLYSRFGQT